VNLAVAATVFAVVFTAELPDKTALASLILGSRYRPAWVFAGIAAASPCTWGSPSGWAASSA
jgi:Ca2+/H+ antiporter, TMEM165/GDT1 family